MNNANKFLNICDLKYDTAKKLVEECDDIDVAKIYTIQIQSTISEINAQIKEAQANHSIHKIKGNDEWYLSALTKLKYAKGLLNLSLQKLHNLKFVHKIELEQIKNDVISDKEKSRQERARIFERQFVDVAKEVLPSNVFENIKKMALKLVEKKRSK